MKLSNLVSAPEFNVARNIIDGSSYKKATSEQLASLMYRNGWLETSFIGIRDVDEAEQLVLQQSLEVEYARLKAQDSTDILYSIVTEPAEQEGEKNKTTKVSVGLLLAEFEKTYCKKGAVVAGNKAVVYGHHRTHMLLVANAARANNDLDRLTPKTLLVTGDWHNACLRENGDRDAAVTKVSTLDFLRQAYEFKLKSVEEPKYTEAYHYNLLNRQNRGELQKAWAFAGLAIKWPELNLYELATTQAEDCGIVIIRYRSLDKEILRQLFKGSKKGKKAETAQEVWEYVTAPLENKKITTSECENIAESVSNKVVRDVLQAVNTSDRKALAAWSSTAILFNAIQNNLPSDTSKFDANSAIEVLNLAVAELTSDLEPVAPKP